MKKLLSLLIVLSMVFLGTSNNLVFAAEEYGSNTIENMTEDDDFDPSSFEVINVGETKTVNFSYSSQKVTWFSFTPTVKATYGFYSEDAPYDVVGHVYEQDIEGEDDDEVYYYYEAVDDEDDQIWGYNDFIFSAKLKANKTYYFAMAPAEFDENTPDFSYKVGIVKDFFNKEDIKDDMDFTFKLPSSAESMTINKNKTVSLSIKQPIKYYTFKASKTGTYLLYADGIIEDKPDLFVCYGEKNGTKYELCEFDNSYYEGSLVMATELEKGKNYCIVIGYDNYNSLTKPTSFDIQLVYPYISTEIEKLEGATRYEMDFCFWNEWFTSVKVGETKTLNPKINKDANPKLNNWSLSTEKEEDEENVTIDGLSFTVTKAGDYVLQLNNGYDVNYIYVEADDHVHTYGESKIKKANLSTNTNGSIYFTCADCGHKRAPGTIEVPKKLKLRVSDYTYTGKVIKPSVKISEKSEFGSDFDYILDKEFYKVTYASGRKNVGTYKVTATGKGKYYTGKMTATFKINPKGTKLSKVTSAKKAFTAKWKKQTAKMNKHITGYEIQYSTSSSFKSGNKTKVVKGYKSTSKKITGLKAKKKYYVRIRTYSTVSGKKYYSKWSAKKSVKTK